MAELGYIYLSFSRSDGHAPVERLGRALAARGIGTWHDKRRIQPDQDTTAEIENRIANSRIVLVCLTNDTKHPDTFVKREINYAISLQKPIITLRFANIVPQLNIVTYEWIDFFREWDSSLERLVEVLGADEPAALTAERIDDPYAGYLSSLYKSIVRYLDRTVFSIMPTSGDLIKVSAEETLAAVEAPAALPMAFFEKTLKSQEGADMDGRRYDDFQQAFRRYGGRVLLLGSPGGGKTTTIMAFVRNAVVQRLGDVTQPLPIMVPVGTWEPGKHRSVGQWLGDAVPSLGKEAISEELERGNVLLVLDGLDELGSEREEKSEDGTLRRYDPRARFIDFIANIGCQMVITCREKDYYDIGSRLKLKGAVTLKPLDDSQLKAYLGDVPQLWNFLAADAQLREMARTPLLLSLIAFTLGEEGGEASGLRDLGSEDLRDKVFSNYVARRYEHEKRRVGNTLSYSLKDLNDVLGHLAMDRAGGRDRRGDVLQRNDFETALPKERVEEFIGLISRLSIVVPTEEKDTWRFIHLKLRDYFAYRFAVERLHDENLYVRQAAIRAIQTIGDLRIFSYLLKALHDDDDGVRRTAVKALEELKDRRAVESLIPTLSDSSLDVRRSAITALGRIGDTKAIQPLVLQTKDLEREIRRSAIQALGQIGSPSAVEPLIPLLQDEDFQIRESAIRALGQIGSPNAVKPLIHLLQESDANTKEIIVQALGQIGDPQSVEDVLGVIVYALKKGEEGVWKSGVNTFLSTLETQDRDKSMRTLARQLFARVGKPAVEPLIKALYGDDWQGRLYAMDCLVEIGKPAVLPLIALLKNSSSLARSFAAVSLGKIADREAISPLIAVLSNDSEETVRSNAAFAFELLTGEEAVAPLINSLNDKYGMVRYRAIDALKAQGFLAVSALTKAMADPREPVQQGAAQALVGLRNASAVESLKETLGSSEKAIRDNAVRALIAIGAPAVGLLVPALQDDNTFRRDSAVRILGEIGDPRALPPLLNALKHSEPEMRRDTVLAIGQIGSPQAVEPLINALRDESLPVCEEAIRALAKLGKVAVAPLMSALQEHEDHNIRDNVIKSLGAIGVEGIDVLASTLHASDADLRETALRALFDVGDLGQKAIATALAARDSQQREDVADLLVQSQDERSIVPLMLVLNSQDPDIHKNAERALIALDTHAVDPLIDALTNRRNRRVQYRVGEILGKIRNHRVVDPLLGAFLDGDHELSQVAASGLVKLGALAHSDLLRTLQGVAPEKLSSLAATIASLDNPEALSVLISAVDCPDESVRETITIVIEAMKTRRTQVLVEALQNESRFIRYHVALLLGRTGSVEAVNPLLMLLKDPEAIVRSGAATALGSLQAKQSTDPLASLLRDPESRVRSAAATALGRLKDPRTVEWLLPLLLDPDLTVAIRVADAIGDIGDKKAAAEMIAALRDARSSDMSVSIARALGKLRDSKAITPLMGLIRHSSGDVQKAAGEAVALFGNEALTPLVNLWDGGAVDESCRRTVAYAIAGLRTPRAIEVLLGMLADNDNEISTEAMKALAALGDESQQPLRNVFQAKSRDIRSRLNAGAALTKIHFSRAVKSLQDVLNDKTDNPDVRSSAARGLGTMRHTSSVALLAKIFRDNGDAVSVRKEAAVALGLLGKAKVLTDVLTGLLPVAAQDQMSPEADLSMTVIDALGSALNEDAVAKLAEILTDNTHDVAFRRRAAQAINQIVDSPAFYTLFPITDALSSIADDRDGDAMLRKQVSEVIKNLALRKGAPNLT